MSALREALQQELQTLPVVEYENGYRVQALPKARLLDLMGMHRETAAEFTFTEDDLLSLARGVVPEWLRFDADAALDEELSK